MIEINDKDFFKLIERECKENYDLEIIDGFPRWVLKSYFQLSDEEIEAAIEGLSTNDDAIDAFFINNETKEINLIQFKAIKSYVKMNQSKSKKEWFDFLYNSTNKLESEDYIEKHKNQRIKEISADYIFAKRRGFETRFHFFHLGYLAYNHKEIIKSFNSNDVRFLYYSFKDIKDSWQTAISKISETKPETFEIDINYNKDLQVVQNQITTGKSTLISIISGDQIIKLRDEHKFELFDKNVRFHLGSNKVNKVIKESALNETELFYFYNNGLTIACSKFKFKEGQKKILVSHPQIINGAQTVESIYEAYKDELNRIKSKSESTDMNELEKEALEKFKKLTVLFRLIWHDPTQIKFSEKVIRFNNTQTAIKSRDFYSQNPEQRELQKKFSELGYFYEIKRGERNTIKKNKHIHLKKKISDFEYHDEKIDIERLAKLLRAFNGEPSQKEASQKIFDDEEIYTQIFGSSPKDITLEKTKKMILAYNFFDVIEKEASKYNKALIFLNRYDDKTIKYNKLKEVILDLDIIGNVIKNQVSDEIKFKEKKEDIFKRIRTLHCFTQGKYQVLAIIKLILYECGYLELLIEKDLYSNKSLIKGILNDWWKNILHKILLPVFKTTEENASVSAFYLNPKTFERLKEKFENLEYDEDKQFKEIFPLLLSK